MKITIELTDEQAVAIYEELKEEFEGDEEKEQVLETVEKVNMETIT